MFIDPYEIQHAIRNGISIPTGAGSVQFSAGTLSAVRTDITFSNSNGVSFGLDGAGVLTASVAPAGGGLTNIKVSAGTLSDLRSDITFSNSGGVSFGLNGAGVITATVATNYQSQGAYLTTAQPPGAYLTTAALSQDSSKYAGTGFTTATTAGTNIVGTLNNSGLSMGVPAYLTTAAAGSGAGTGFTTVTTAGSNVVGTLDTNGLSMGIPAYLTTAMGGSGAGTNTSVVTTVGSDLSMALNTNGLTIAYPKWLTAAMGTQVSVATITGTDLVLSGNFSGVTASYPKWITTAQPPGAYLTTAMGSDAGSSFVQANATFFGTNASGTIASNAISVSVAPPAAVNIKVSAGTLSSDVSAITFSNGSGVSFGFDGSNITATVATNYQPPGAYLTTAMASDASSAFAGTNGSIVGGSFTLNTSGATISLPAYLTTFSYPRLDQVLDPTADKVFSMGSNQLQLSWATGGSFSTNATRQGMFELDVAGNVTQEADVVHAHQHGGAPTKLDMFHVEGDGANVTGLRLQMSATVAAEVNQPIKFTTEDAGYSIGSVPMILGTQMSNSVANLNANYLQGRVSSQMAGLGFTSASTAGTAVVATLSTNGLSMGIPAYITTYVNDLTSDRAGTNTSVLTTAGTDLSFAVNTSGVTIAYPKWLTAASGGGGAGTGFTSATTGGTAIVGTLGTGGLSMGVPNYLKHMVVTGNGAMTISTSVGFDSVSFSVPATTQLVGVSGIGISTSVSTISIYGSYAGTGASVVTTAGSDLSFAGNTNGLTIAYPKWLTTAAQSSGPASYWNNLDVLGATTTTMCQSNSFYVLPLFIQCAVSASYLRLLASFNFTSTTIATTAVNNATGASTAFSETVAFNAVLYTAGVGGNSRSLQQIFSSYGGLTWAVSVSQASTTNATNQSFTQRITYPSEGFSTATVSTQYSVSATNGPISTTQWSNLSAQHYLDIPFATSLSAGVYWLALNRLSGTAGGKNLDCNATTYGVSNTNMTWANLNDASNVSNCGPFLGLGLWTQAAAGTSASIGLAAISQQSSYMVPLVQFIRQA